MIPPVLVRPEVMAGTGFLGAHADEVYRLEADDLYLVGTSEVPLAGYHSDEILDLADGPLRYAGWSSCFRREAGSYGKDTRGIIRVHQFDKVEGFVYCRPEEAEAEHQRLLGWQREMLAHIEVPYRVIDVAAGDLGSSAARKFDCEAWVPTQGDLPRADVDVELHHLPGAPAGDALPGRQGQAADRGHAQRHVRHHALVGLDPGESPAARRQRAGARGTGAVCGHRAAGAGLSPIRGHPQLNFRSSRQFAVQLSCSELRPMRTSCRGAGGFAMSWLVRWWRQSDHYEQLSSHLRARGMDMLTRTTIASIAALLALVAIATIWTPTGPRGRVQIACALAAGVGAAVGALIWGLRWPTRAAAIRFALLSNASIALVALAQDQPLAAMLTCTTFAATGGVPLKTASVGTAVSISTAG